MKIERKEQLPRLHAEKIKTPVQRESNEDGDKTLIFAPVSVRQRLKIKPRNTLVLNNISAPYGVTSQLHALCSSVPPAFSVSLYISCPPPFPPY